VWILGTEKQAKWLTPHMLSMKVNELNGTEMHVFIDRGFLCVLFANSGF
jgi:hypothetical protein